MAALAVIYMFLRFYDMICKKQRIYCFFPFGFVNVIIFVINPSGFYSAFVGAYLEDPNFLRFDRGG